jgi:hypothetical protein
MAYSYKAQADRLRNARTALATAAQELAACADYEERESSASDGTTGMYSSLSEQAEAIRANVCNMLGAVEAMVDMQNR